MERRMKRSSRVSYDQLTLLVGILEQNRELATGYLNTTAGRHNSARMWQDASARLNSIKGGAVKDPKGWSAYWSDFKNKLKKKKRRNRHMELTGAGPLKPLSEVEERALIMLGDNFCGIQPSASNEMEQETLAPERQNVVRSEIPPENRKTATHRLATAVESIATAAESIATAQQGQAAAMRAAAAAVETAATAITRAVRIFETIAGHCGDEPNEDCKPVPFLNLG